jgi:hypothetical protein
MCQRCVTQQRRNGRSLCQNSLVNGLLLQGSVSIGDDLDRGPPSGVLPIVEPKDAVAALSHIISWPRWLRLPRVQVTLMPLPTSSLGSVRTGVSSEWRSLRHSWSAARSALDLRNPLSSESGPASTHSAISVERSPRPYERRHGGAGREPRGCMPRVDGCRNISADTILEASRFGFDPWCHYGPLKW